MSAKTDRVRRGKHSSAPPTDTNQPIIAQLPVATSTPPYAFSFGAVPAGTYTLAFTCNAASDNPTQADSSVTFYSPAAVQGFTVTADTVTTENIS